MNHGAIYQGGFSHPSGGYPSAGHIVTSPSGFAHGPNTFATHAPSAAHSTIGGAGQHFDASHWTGSHATVPHSSSGFSQTSGGHSAWTPVGTHAAGTLHSTFGDTGHHFDASHWTGGHFGDVHHFDPFHHDDHHVIYEHHDFHHGHSFFFGAGFYGWSYPRYYYNNYPSYYDYLYSYPPSYYEVPVDYSTNSPYGTDVTPGNYQMPQAGNTSAPAETRFPDVAMPRMELPSVEAPEALPDGKTPESPQPEGLPK